MIAEAIAAHCLTQVEVNDLSRQARDLHKAAYATLPVHDDLKAADLRNRVSTSSRDSWHASLIENRLRVTRVCGEAKR